MLHCSNFPYSHSIPGRFSSQRLLQLLSLSPWPCLSLNYSLFLSVSLGICVPVEIFRRIIPYPFLLLLLLCSFILLFTFSYVLDFLSFSSSSNKTTHPFLGLSCPVEYVYRREDILLGNGGAEEGTGVFSFGKGLK